MAKITLDETPNTISVDWESGAEPPYAQAVSNARVVALEVIGLLKTLKVDIWLLELFRKIIHTIHSNTMVSVQRKLKSSVMVLVLTLLDM